MPSLHRAHAGLPGCAPVDAARGSRRSTTFLLLLLFWAFCIPLPAHAEDSEFFEKRVRPILVEHCYKCHSTESAKLKGKLRLDTREGVLAGGENGPVLVPGDPDKSRLIVSVRYTDDDLQMPPKERLTAQQVADLVAWVKMGAPDPRTGGVAATLPAAPPPYDFAAARRMWAFSKPVSPPLPVVRRRDWVKSPVDRFILAKLEERGLVPAAPADKRSLLRRATFDLIGLPPTAAEMEAFLADDSPDAFAKVIDRLLASPQYGEHWARHWLDVVRYTDSFDSRGDDVPDSYRYRDWVVNAFNADMPYDQFIENQIAGDLLPADKPGERNADGIIATGVYVLGNWGGGDADKEKMMTDIVDDQVDVTGRAFLGLTLACARCHDHKFDPIPTADYYSLAGIFFSSHILPGPGVKTAGSPVLRIPLASPAELEQLKQHDAALAESQKKIDAYADQQWRQTARGFLPQADRYLAAAWELQARKGANAAAVAKDDQLDPVVLQHWVDYLALDGQPALAPKLLAKPTGGTLGVEGLIGDDGRPCPCVNANATDRVLNLGTVTLPPHCLSIHPGPGSAVAVRWISPVTTTVKLSGSVTDADAHCGDGIAWKLYHRPASGPRRELAAGDFVNGGTQKFADGRGAASLSGIAVQPGDVIELVVDPRGEYTCDTTVVELEIAEQRGQQQAWKLTHDVVPRLIAGREAVWQFCEVPLLAKSVSLPADCALLKWLAAAAGVTDREQIRSGATRVRDALMAIDTSPNAAGPDAQLYRDLIEPRGLFWGATKPDDLLPPAAKKSLAAMRAELDALKKNAPPIRFAHGMEEGGVPDSRYVGFHDSAILMRGRYDRPGDIVPRRFPRLLAGDDQPSLPNASARSGRLELARWIASPKNPLTARVMVNRIWQHHFGQGIVRTPNNFGKLGTPPTHPELLDFLATQFMEHGWSVKAMHRAIMLSAAYQQSSVPDAETLKSDPGNFLVGRMNRRRLEAEELRDAMLAVTDLLGGAILSSPSRGGAAGLSSGRGDSSVAIGGPAITDLNAPRRTLYLMTIRSDRSNYRMLFDAADPTGIVEQRIDSTVAPQALFMLNSAFALRQSESLAALVLRQNPPDARTRLDWLYRRLYGRAPVEAEIRIGLGFLGETPSPAAWGRLCQILLCANEFVYVD